MNDKNRRKKKKLLNDQMHVIESLLDLDKKYESIWIKTMLAYSVLALENNMIKHVSEKKYWVKNKLNNFLKSIYKLINR